MFDKLNIQRWPTNSDRSLQAWNAADELMVAHLLDNVEPSRSVLLVNDAFGALCCGLHQYECTHWSDSYLSQQAAQRNLASNFDSTSIQFVDSTALLEGTFDVVLLKVPKTVSLLEYQLSRLRDHLHDSSLVIAGGMIKYLSSAYFKAFETMIGPVTTSLAQKKARLIFAAYDPGLAQSDHNEWSQYSDPAVGFSLYNQAGLFSRGGLDLGTRFFLQHFDSLPKAERVVDLACGNGVLGLKYQLSYPDTSMTYLDESHLAIASARKNLDTLIEQDRLAEPAAKFIVGDAMAGIPSESVELILCNPPFHQGQEVGRGTAARFFQQSKACLKARGEIWIVANRHLGYDKLLKATFGHCQQRAINNRFVILQAKKR